MIEKTFMGFMKLMLFRASGRFEVARIAAAVGYLVGVDATVKRL